MKDLLIGVGTASGYRSRPPGRAAAAVASELYAAVLFPAKYGGKPALHRTMQGPPLCYEQPVKAKLAVTGGPPAVTVSRPLVLLVGLQVEASASTV